MSFNSGGSGSSNISTSTDVALSNPTDQDVLLYDLATAKWKNDPAITSIKQAVPVSFATLADAQAAGANGELAIGQLVVIG